VVEKLARLDPAATVSEWLREPANSRELADALCDLIPPTLATVEDSEVRNFIERTIASQFQSLDLVAVVDRVMGQLSIAMVIARFSLESCSG
jgi:uncharacterized membrane-anchored protein YjiN (DUF445 family)